MSTRRARSLALRPRTENLEDRRLLSATFHGTDLDGDTYTIRLAGTGDFRVSLVDASGNPVTDPSQPALIDSIEIAGANPTSSRLIGRVTKGANGDGRVFFQNLTEEGGLGEGPQASLGIHVIDLPGFYLGATTTATSAGVAGQIRIPDGVNTLRFGGVDTTFTRPGATPLNQNNTSDQFNIQLGLPYNQGTSIVVDRIVTSGQAGQPTNGQPGTPTQDGVTFDVIGRINTFQANSIEGNTAFPTTGFQGGGGTLVRSDPTSSGTITGSIGFVRVGGNATNFAVQSGGGNGLVSNFYVGGETNNVLLLALAGSRNIYFGKGMDTTTILTHYIASLRANRGALNSTVAVDRNVGQVVFGGDVVNTNFLSGLQQNLPLAFQNQQAPQNPIPGQDGGAISQVLVAGNIQNSVFAASVNPSGGVYGTADDLTFPHGNISAKVEGTIDNPSTLTDDPTRAFFAHDVHVVGGPVVPPGVPEAPFPNPGAPPSGDGINFGLQPTDPGGSQAATASGQQASAQAAARSRKPAPAHTAAVRAATGVKTPRGPLGSSGGASPSGKL